MMVAGQAAPATPRNSWRQAPPAGWRDLRLAVDKIYPAKVPGAGMEDGCSVDIGGDKLLAIGGYWETEQVILASV